jgi:hypothetical protein
MTHDDYLLPEHDLVALEQLCSRGFVGLSEADPVACAELEDLGLALRTLIGHWVPTIQGRSVNAHGGQLHHSPAGHSSLHAGRVLESGLI